MWPWELREKAEVIWKGCEEEEELLKNVGHKWLGHWLYLAVVPIGELV